MGSVFVWPACACVQSAPVAKMSAPAVTSKWPARKKAAQRDGQRLIGERVTKAQATSPQAAPAGPQGRRPSEMRKGALLCACLCFFGPQSGCGGCGGGGLPAKAQR